MCTYSIWRVYDVEKFIWLELTQTSVEQEIMIIRCYALSQNMQFSAALCPHVLFPSIYLHLKNIYESFVQFLVKNTFKLHKKF